MLQGFNSTLTMLDGRGEGGGRSQGGGYDEYDQSYGGDNGGRSSAPARASNQGNRSSTPAPSFSRDMDDDIPF